MRRFLLPLLFVGALASCAREEVNTVVTKENNTIVVSYSDVSETVSMPLSTLVKGINLLQLETKDDANVDQISSVSAGYLLAIKMDGSAMLNLFDANTGAFVSHIGAEGDYKSVQVSMIDEAHKRVFFKHVGSNNLFVYGFDGKLQMEIPMANVMVGQPAIDVDFDKELITVASVVQGSNKFVWQQDFTGKELSFKGSQYAFQQGNCILLNNAAQHTFFIQDYDKNGDSLSPLMYYNAEENRIDTLFKLKYAELNNLRNENEKIHLRYEETNKYILMKISREYDGKYSFDAGNTLCVDKDALTCKHLNIYDDILGLIKSITFRNGYFSQMSMAPANAVKWLEGGVASASSAIKSRLESEIKRIDLDGNMVVVRGEMKN